MEAISRDNLQSRGHGESGGAQRLLWLIPVIALVIYSATLLYIEATTSQDHVRTYFTDIGRAEKRGLFAAPNGEIGYAINTSLAAFLFGAAGVMTLFAGLGQRKRLGRAEMLFALQGCVLLYLSADDRLMLHERIGHALHTYSTVILAVTGLVNVAIYLMLFRFRYFNRRMIVLMIVAGVLIFAMTVCDLLLPHAMPLRLSVEDLLKTWAAFFFLCFGWEAARFRLVDRSPPARQFALPAGLANRLPPFLRRIVAHYA